MSTRDESESSFDKSKTRKKLEAHALQDLGSELAQLSEDQLDRIRLPENLVDAILAYQHISSHGGRKRQLQYIGKLMRDIDAEPVKLALQELRLQHKRETARFHQIEQWRDDLLHDSTTVMDELLARFPDTDLQHIRQLVRNAHKESKQNKPPKSARTLFKYLQTLQRDTES